MEHGNPLSRYFPEGHTGFLNTGPELQLTRKWNTHLRSAPNGNHGTYHAVMRATAGTEHHERPLDGGTADQRT